MSELMSVNLNPNRYDMYTVASTEDANPIAQTPVVIDEVGGSSKKSSSSAWATLQGWGNSIASHFNSKDRVGFVGCNSRDSGQLDWDTGIPQTLDPDSGVPTFGDSGVPVVGTGDATQIVEALVDGAYFFVTDELGFTTIAGGENLQNTPLQYCMEVDTTLISGWPADIASTGNFVNVTPRDEANALYCYESEWVDDFGMRIPTDGLGSGPDHWVADPADIVARIGYEEYPYAYCWDWPEFNVAGTYAASVHLQCVRPDGEIVYDATPIVTTEDNVLDPATYGAPAALSTTDASGVPSAVTVCTPLPFYEDENNGVKCNNPDGTFKLKSSVRLLGDGRSIMIPPGMSNQFRAGLRGWTTIRE